MNISSPAFAANRPIPPKYTCMGEGVNPPLAFDDVPSNAKSLVLIVDDPDAPGGVFVHWVLFNMPASITQIVENSKPEGIEGVTSFGKNEYGGPCPPSGTHRYFFKVYALDSMLDVAGSADKGVIAKAMEGHILDQAELVGLVSK